VERGVQKTAKEITSLRTAHRRVYQNLDGSRTYAIHTGVIHAKVQGQWMNRQELAAAGIVVAMAPDYSETADGYIYGLNDGTYATARSTSSATAANGTTWHVGQTVYSTDTYEVHRVFLSFDTSALADDAVVSDALLYITASTDYSSTNFKVQVYRYAWTEALVDNREADYDGAYGGTAVLEGTLRDTASGWVSGAVYDMEVDPSGINLTGDTKYTLVSEEDVNNSAPTTAEYVDVCLADFAGTGSDPYLLITAAAFISYAAIF